MPETKKVGRAPSAPAMSNRLDNAALVVLSGGPTDDLNPWDVRLLMESLFLDVNASDVVQQNTTDGKGLRYRLLPGQQWARNHHTDWPALAETLTQEPASPLILVGHSNGGAGVINLARALKKAKKTIDLAITVDSVFTLIDNGNPNKVPANVGLNLNPYVIPTDLWWQAPFPIGKPNQRKEDGSQDGILNIGLPFHKGLAFAHHDAFYDLAGGHEPGIGGPEYPNVILASILKFLGGSSVEAIFAVVRDHLQKLADRVRIKISLDSTNPALHATLDPAGFKVNTPFALSQANERKMRQALAELEKLRQSLHSKVPGGY